ncbi:MAG: hypothetical protein JWM63_2211 [Gammaproteobacteria bacterium]|nr:hypothetical protein [Gammaproteobacteria bacterium]
MRIRGEAVWAGLGVTEWSVIPCNVSVTDVFVKDRRPVLLVAETRRITLEEFRRALLDALAACRDAGDVRELLKR